MNNEAIKKIADTYGYDAQSRQLIEEMAELMVSINKLWRVEKFCESKDILDIKGFSVPETRNVIEEIADVTIMLEEIKYLLQISDTDINEIIEQKLNRQLERMRRMSELKCCPFCGGKATLKRDQKDDFVEWSVGCYNRGCVCSAHTYCYDNKDDAIRDWNTRTPMSNIVEKLEGLKKRQFTRL